MGDVKTAVGVESHILANLKLVAGLLGQLVQRHEVTHANILISADYLRLRQVVMKALQPYPEAMRAIGAALHALETEVGDTTLKEVRDEARRLPAPSTIDAVPV